MSELCIYKGKVRDIYNIDDKFFIDASHRSCQFF